MEFGEDPLQSIKREIKEEAGLTVKNLRLFDIEAHINPAGEHWITLAYMSEALSERLKISWEHDLYKWVTLTEFLKMDTPKKLKYFARTLRGLKK